MLFNNSTLFHAFFIPGRYFPSLINEKIRRWLTRGRSWCKRKKTRESTPAHATYGYTGYRFLLLLLLYTIIRPGKKETINSNCTIQNLILFYK